ncbi:hypothetical protein V5F41_12565 [Xanthobacter autotrophicus]|uniref:hypothetical protein n=1 Tax=Xanthobacter autotrophicus TaxID=280 RepID=UPI003727658B
MRFRSETPAQRGPMAEMVAGCVADLGRHEAYTLAVDCLRCAGGFAEAALPAFLRTLTGEREGRMLAAVVGQEAVERAALAFLNCVAADMRGGILNASPGGQASYASTEAKPLTPLGDAPNAPAGHLVNASSEATLVTPAGAPEAGAMGHESRASTEATKPAPIVPAPPSPQARATALAARAAISDNLLDTYLIDGMPIGDMRMDQVRRLAKVKREQSEVLAAIAAHAGGAAGHMRVREVYTNVRLTRDLTRAERKSHAIAC